MQDVNIAEGFFVITQNEGDFCNFLNLICMCILDKIDMQVKLCASNKQFVWSQEKNLQFV